jgi:CrcB protein
MTVVYLAIGGALGAIARYFIADRIGAWADSGAVGIFAVNVLGSFLIGLFLGLGEQRFDWSFETRVLVATGFLGGFTTFSTLTWQTYGLAHVGDYASAVLNMVGSVVIGMTAVYAGVGLARVAD